jgi:hypothetical protein
VITGDGPIYHSSISLGVSALKHIFKKLAVIKCLLQLLENLLRVQFL